MKSISALGRVEHVNQSRSVVQWTLRSIALLMLLLGAYLCIKRILFGFLCGAGISHAFQVWDGIGESHSLYRGMALLIVGTVLAMLNNTISRWIISVPTDDCPRCGHMQAPPPADGESDPTRCPECGLVGAWRQE